MKHIKQTHLFAKQKKKLKSQQIQALDKAVRMIAADTSIGEQKKGDLKSVYVYKFKVGVQQYLLAYTFITDEVTLLAVGVHENFYRKLKNTFS